MYLTLEITAAADIDTLSLWNLHSVGKEQHKQKNK